MKRTVIGLVFAYSINVVICALIIFTAAPVFGGSAKFYYSDGPWSGKVIDSETKAPIEGAVVVALWDKVYATPAGDNSFFLDAVEKLTDKEGAFLIPSFSSLNMNPLARIAGPTFIIFKPGYTSFPGEYYQYFHEYFPKSPLRVSNTKLEELFKSGAVVELMELKTREARLRNTPALPTDVSNTKLPIFDSLIKEEDKNLGLKQH